MPDYLPRSQGRLLSWATSFSSNIEVAPQEYGLSIADAEAIAQVVQAYQSAYARAVTPQTRTSVALMTRERQRKNMLEVVRKYANVIRADRTVSDDMKVRLGLAVKGPGRKRVPLPTTRPILNIVAIDHCRHHLHCADGSDTEGSWKPADAVGMQLFCHVGTTAPADPLDARFERFVTRPRYIVQFKPEQVGKTAFYVARWQTARGDTGPWSATASRMIAG